MTRLSLAPVSSSRYRLGVLVALLPWILAGCATPGGVCTPSEPFQTRVERQHRSGLVVEAVALSRCESEATFGVALNDINVQPVWLKIENFREDPHWLFPIAIDNDYFPTYEVARRASALGGDSVDDLYERFRDQEMKWFVPPEATVSGFVFAHSDEGLKAFNVQLVGSHAVDLFSFVVQVPGLPTTYFDVDEAVRSHQAAAPNLNAEAFQEWLRRSDCCAVDVRGAPGDPLNIVFVGSLDRLRSALISRHWDVTAPVDEASLRRMVSAFLFGSRFRYAPISSLFVFGREQDLSFQKSRAIIDERNHMRLWLAPVRFEGRAVWLGQVSRDVGIKLSGRLWPPTTHVIDPDVDDARFYVLQDMLAGGLIEKVGFVQGQRPADVSSPHHNAEHDPYFTDGLRNVFVLSRRQVKPSEIQLLDWELPSVMEPFRGFYLRRE